MSTRLDFAGALAWWQALAIAAAGMLLAWRLYRRDVNRVPRRWCRVVLPGLRALAVFAVLSALAGPVLTHRRTEGQLGRVLVVVDASRSMSTTDEHLSAGRKLLIAVARGAIPTDRLDLRLAELERSLSEMRAPAGPSTDRQGAPGVEPRIDRLVAALQAAAGKLKDIDPAQLPELDPPRGAVTVEYFDAIPGSGLNDLATHAKFQQAASRRDTQPSLESQVNRGDNYGTRIRGYVYPPLTGAYVFRINSDDDSALALSPDADPAKKKVIARINGYTPMNEWDVLPAQKSAPIEMVAGRRYYIEVLHKEGNGEDFVRVGWDRPDGRQERPIPGIHLSMWDAQPLRGPEVLARLQRDFESELLEPARRLSKLDGPREAESRRRGLEALAAPLAAWERRFGEAFGAYAARWLEAADAPTRQAIARFEAETRWRRAESIALGADRGFLPELAETHEVQLVALAGREVRRLWSSVTRGDSPEVLDAKPDGELTDLTDGIRPLISERAERTAVVLLSDGRHNQGDSPLELARLMGARQVPLHLVGLGNPVDPPDLAVESVESPKSVFSDDRVKGQVVLKDHMPPGRPFTLTISHNGREIWRQELSTSGEGPRRIDFDFGAKEAMRSRRRADQADVEILAEPLKLDVAVSAVKDEAEPDNNSANLRFMVTSQGRRILLLDGRPRWETRFIRDLFDRDRQWRIDPLIQVPGAGGPAWSQVDGPGRFPPDRETLFTYGLMILGELPPETLTADQIEWIRDFVEKRGGALILVDGPRGHLRDFERTALRPLIPVGPTDSFGRSAPDHLELTALGRQSAALTLESDAIANATLWRSFPGPHWVAPVRALEGTETLADVVCADDRRVPGLVYRRVGAGGVLYCAFDETWRWRYQVADRYQTKYWNQIANWLMEAPFTVKSRYVAIDAGGPAIQAGRGAHVRVQLTGRDGKPLAGAKAEAVLYRDGTKVVSTALQPDANRPGLYRAETAPLEPGEYEVAVSVEGFSDLETKARAPLAVEPREEPEMAELSCDEELLRAMAAASGGVYLREEDAGRLAGLLKPLSDGKIVVTETRLAQSYWWFVPVIALLTLEWLLRKRVGLM